MNKLLTIGMFVLISLSTYGQYQKVHTFKNNVWFYTDLDYSVRLQEIDKTKGQVKLYSTSDFLLVQTNNLYMPSGYQLDSLHFMGYDVDNKSSGDEFGYITRSTGGNTIGVICDANGKALKTFNDAIAMRSIIRGSENQVIVTTLKSGKTTSDVYSYGPNFSYEASYPTDNLKHDATSEYGPYYYTDVATSTVQVYTYDHTFSYDVDISVPSGYTLTTGLSVLKSNVLNNDSYQEFGVYFQKGSNRWAKIVNEKFEVQSYSGVTGMKMYELIGSDILALRHYSTGKPKWEIHKIDNTKSTNTTSLWVSHAGEPYFSEYYETGLVFDADSMSLFKYESFNKNHAHTVKTGLASNDEVINWTAYYAGISDADSRDTELFYLWKSAAGKYGFNVKRSDGSTLLTVSNARRFRTGFLGVEYSTLIVEVPGVGMELYQYDYSLKAPNRISPAHKSEQLDFKTQTFTWNKVENAVRYALQIYTDSTGPVNLAFNNLLDTTYTVEGYLDSATTYYWRVIASHQFDGKTNPGVFRFRTFDAGALKAPTLLSPKDNTVDLDISTYLTWEKEDNADSYEFQYSENSDFSTSTQGIVTGTSKQLTPLKYGTQYFWRVRTKRGVSLSDWSTEWSFTTMQKPSIDPPVLISPADEKVDVSTTPFLTWQAVTDATKYTYEYATKPDFSDGGFGSTTSTSAGLKGLDYNTVYFWRVKVEKGGELSSWSKVWSFTTIQKPSIDAPLLTSPTDGTLGASTNTDITWQAVADASGYAYEYATESDFSNMSTGTASGTSAVLNGLNINTMYYWRVKAEKSGEFSSWSEVWSFTTSDVPALTKPTLVSPANMATAVSPSTTVLEWNAVTGAETYQVQLSIDVNFGTFSTGAPTGATISFSDLKEMTTYYWRVKAIKGNAESEWSDIWVFTTDETQSIGNGQFSQSINVYPNPAKYQLNVELTDKSSERCTITLIDLAGHRVLETSTNQGVSTLDISHLKKGAYFLQLEQGTKFTVRKVMVN